MSSAKIIISEHDNSGFVPSISGIYGGMAHPARKGKVLRPLLVTSESNYVSKRGNPDPKMGSFAYDAFAFLTQSDKFWSVRVTHTNAKTKPDGSYVRDDSTLSSKVRYEGEARFSASLVRATVKDVDLTSPNAVFSSESMVVKPLFGGLVQDEVDSFSFPEYMGTRTYSSVAVNALVKYPVVDSKKVTVSDTSVFEIGDMFSVSTNGLDLNQTSEILTVTEIGSEDVNYEAITLSAQVVSVLKGAEVKKKVGVDYVSYPDMPYVTNNFNGSNQVTISNTDHIADGDIVVFGNDINEYVVTSKDIVPVKEHFIVVDQPTNISVNESMFKVEHYEIEQRDALLVISESQGIWGNKISVGIENSKVHNGAFDVIVYENGAEVERWKDCTRDSRLDGYGKQMFVEDRINGKSAYIEVISNPMLDESIAPLETNVSYWRENEVDVFVDSGITTTETVNSTDFYIKVTGTLPIGTRIKFGTYSDEYKVSNIVNGQIVLDRPFIPNKIAAGTKINQYSHTETKPITKINGVKAGVSVGATYALGTKIGKIIDAGANFLVGGDDGSAVTVYDLINGYNQFANREEIDVALLMDGGFAHPALAQKIVQIADSREDCFVYLSTDPEAEDSKDYLNKIVEYRNSLNLNTSNASLFAGWVEVADPYNQKNVWISPVGFAMAAQSYTATNDAMWYPAAGWNRGGFSALRVKRAFDQAERDFLVANQVNPIRYKNGAGLAIWGNETLLTLPSVLQSRHVRMLLIVIKRGLRAYLEGKHYDLNTDRGRQMIEAAINAYMRDEIGDGVYDYTVAVEKYTTKTDIANKTVRVFLGIQPTLEMKEFKVDLTLFSANQKIEIA